MGIWSYQTGNKSKELLERTRICVVVSFFLCKELEAGILGIITISNKVMVMDQNFLAAKNKEKEFQGNMG